MKPRSCFTVLLLFASHLVCPNVLAQDTIFEGEGIWSDDSLWDAGVPTDGSSAAINGICTILENTAPTNGTNPSEVIIGDGTEGSLRVSGGTLSGAHGGSRGVSVGRGEGGIGTLTIDPGAAYRSQGGGMVVRIGDLDGGEGKVVVAGELLNYKFFELINGTLEMMPTGVNALFNSSDLSLIGADGTLSYVIDGPNVGPLKRSNASGLVVDIEEGANLKITLGGDFSVGDSWSLMSYTELTGTFSQGDSFISDQGYTFGIDYGAGSDSELILTLQSDENRPTISEFSATPSAASSGESVTLSWNVDQFITLMISDVGDVTAEGGQGSMVVNPTETTTYTLTVDFDDIIVTQDVTVVVDALPVINSLTVTPTVVAPGQEAVLSWNTSGAADVTITPGLGAVSLVGTSMVTPAETTTYLITAKNGTGEITEEVTLTVDAIAASRIRSYDAAGESQTDGGWLDSVAFRNYDMKNMELVSVEESPNTSLTKAFQILSSTNDTGGDNGDGFPFSDVSFEVWLRTADLDEFRQIIFETGAGSNGTSLSIDDEALYFWHSSEGERTVDLTIALSQLNVADDFVQVVLSLDSANGKASMFARGAGGGSASVTAEGTIGTPDGRSAIFRWSNFSSGVDGALGGSAGDPPLDVDSFMGQVALINVYDRPLSDDEALDAFSRIATVIPNDDSDDDGLPDFWENSFLGNLASNADGDNDGDTLNNAAELAAGTHPNKADTDDDGLNDAAEINGNPSSDPKVADTDGDGLSDGAEVNGNPASDPTKTDTDGDGFSDGFEVAQGSDPSNAAIVPDNPLGEPTIITDVVGSLPSFNGFEDDLDLVDATFRACVDFSEKSDAEIEVIFETGGGTIGFSLVYEEGSKLVLRAAGEGGLVLATVERALTPAELAKGALELTWTYDVEDENGDQVISLFVDGVSAGSATEFLGGDWSGSNGAAFGVAASGFAGTGENSDLNGIDFLSGTIDETKGLQFFSGRLFEGGAAPSAMIAIVSFDVIGTSATIEWTSVPGAQYTVEGTANYDLWLEIEDSVESEGDTTEFTDDGLPAGTKEYYYRVRLQP